MTEPIKPATPAQAATPGSGVQNQVPSTGAPASTQTGEQGKQPEGMVQIPVSQFNEMQRNDARWRSFQRRSQFTGPSKKTPIMGTPGSGNFSGEGSDDLPDAATEAVHQHDIARQEAESRAFRAELSVGVREILDRPEFSKVPDSMKKMVIKRPWSLTEADNAEEALLDIEDFLRDEILPGVNYAQSPGSSTPSPADGAPGHETPTTFNAGAPASPQAADLENVEGLHGQSRSRAVLRNTLKKQKGTR